VEMEAAMVVCGNEGEMEDNGVFLQCTDGVVWEVVRRGHVWDAVRRGSPFAVRRGNRPVGGAGGGVEELTVQVKWFLLLN